MRPLQLDLGDMLVQVVAVALGVILGFAATSLNERAHQRRLLHETVETIVVELQSNRVPRSRFQKRALPSATANSA